MGSGRGESRVSTWPHEDQASPTTPPPLPGVPDYYFWAPAPAVHIPALPGSRGCVCALPASGEEPQRRRVSASPCSQQETPCPARSCGFCCPVLPAADPLSLRSDTAPPTENTLGSTNFQ